MKLLLTCLMLLVLTGCGSDPINRPSVVVCEEDDDDDCRCRPETTVVVTPWPRTNPK